MGRTILFLATVIVLFANMNVVSGAKDTFTVEMVNRTVSLNRNYVVEKIIIDLQKQEKSWGNFSLVFPVEQYGALAHITVQDDNGNQLQLTEDPNRDPTTWKYIVSLDKVSDTFLKLKVNVVCFDCLKPKPAFIEADEDQFLYYESLVYFYSPYKVKKQKTSISFPTTKVQSANSEQVVPKLSLQGKTGTLGPYKNIEPWQQTSFAVRFANNIPLLVANEVIRLVKVSHWGTIQVRETYELEHKGARLKGPFSRLDFSTSRNYQNAIQDLTARLPSEATDVSYKDFVGNITSSRLLSGDRLKERILYIIFRYPLIGGWKNAFFIGYNLPVWRNLRSLASSRYTFTLPIPPSIRSVHIQNYVFKVALPEGAKDISWTCSKPLSVAFDNTYKETMKDILDVKGRPVLVFERANMIPSSMTFGNIEVTYKLSKWDMSFKFILPTLFLFSLLLFVALVSRLDLRLKPSQVDEDALKQMEIMNLHSIHLTMASIYQEILRKLSAYNQTVTSEEVHNIYSSANKRLRALETQLDDLVKTAFRGDSRLANIANSINEIYKAKHEIVHRWFTQIRSKTLNPSALEKELVQLKGNLEPEDEKIENFVYDIMEEL
eukprot:jgi/Galph1/3624/GphlegSOOS_G2256.1